MAIEKVNKRVVTTTVYDKCYCDNTVRTILSATVEDGQLLEWSWGCFGDSPSSLMRYDIDANILFLQEIKQAIEETKE